MWQTAIENNDYEVFIFLYDHFDYEVLYTMRYLYTCMTQVLTDYEVLICVTHVLIYSDYEVFINMNALCIEIYERHVLNDVNLN